MGNISNMKYQTIKIRIETLKKLRMLHAVTGESMMDLVEKLVQNELDKESNETTKRHNRGDTRETDCTI